MIIITKKKKVHHDSRSHLNIVFIGHVDSGKSTLAGRILYNFGKVDERTIEKYTKEAKEKNRESWFLAYILDCSEEEREKGKTVQVGRASFETKNKRYTILDAPGHELYVPNMIGGASQADVAVLVISAKTGEFESGFNKNGQTCEHAMLVKTLGVSHLVIVINKMDEETVKWSKERYDSIIGELGPFLKKKVGYSDKTITYIPISAYSNINIDKKLTEKDCTWYDGPCLIEALDNLNIKNKRSGGPLRIPIIDKFKERGLQCLLGKIESGTLKAGQKVVIMPNKTETEVVQIKLHHLTVEVAEAGENVQIYIKSLSDFATGSVVCDVDNPLYPVQEFLGQFMVLDTKSIFCAGYTPTLHIHTYVEPVEIVSIVATIDKKTGEKETLKPKYAKSGQIILCKMKVQNPVCIEKFDNLPALGRFTLREKKTVGFGKVMGIKPLEQVNTKTDQKTKKKN